MLDGAEILIDQPLARRGFRMLQALADTRPEGSVVTTAYGGKHRLVVLYGVGAPLKFAAFNRHVAAGGHVACWDLGYWDRDEGMRVSIDALHPTTEQMDLAPATGCRHEITLRNDAKPEGPILLVGMGHKSVSMYGLRQMDWERQALRHIRRKYPDRRVLWRPKGRHATPLALLPMRFGMPIEDALRGCSLVVCRHSNVAIDACIAGVPVECEDGAARALYRGNRAPTPEQRAEFLRKLGWWNWLPSEAAQAWAWIWRVIG
jgi:hypothetical protein